MNGQYADLHIHSFHSDGTMTPAEIVDQAAARGVGVLAIADHNALAGSAALPALCAGKGIQTIPAVEIDTAEGEMNLHLLAYGFDTKNEAFADFVRHTRFLLDEFCTKLIERMQRDYKNISLADFMDYNYDAHLGGWKGLHYLKDRGITGTLKEGMPFYFRYGLTYGKSGYPTVAATAHRIRAAGGYVVLAHPGVSLDTADIDQFKSVLKRLVTQGVQGLECYYPKHSPAVTQACIEVCNECGLLVTAGSDCHGAFGGGGIGEMQIPIDRLKLGRLLS